MSTPEDPTNDWLNVLEAAEAPDEDSRAEVGEFGIVTTGEAMSLSRARHMRRRAGSRLVLVMGEAHTGKTALLSTLWQEIQAPRGLAGHRLAGSRTALGFERRAHWGRVDSGQVTASYPPTPAEENFLLHLRVRRPDRQLVDLLLADMDGNLFEPVRAGRPLLQELPWAAQSDRFVVVVDGAGLSLPGQSEIAATRALRQVLALRSSGVVRADARVALALTKADSLTQLGEQALRRHAPNLLAQAQAVDPEARSVSVSRTTGVGTQQGLGELLTWMCSEPRGARPMSADNEAEGRSSAAI